MALIRVQQIAHALVRVFSREGVGVAQCRCGSVVLRRSHRRWYERWRLWKRPFRCAKCGARAWFLPSSISDPGVEARREP